jgi:hypothetical protein
MSAVPSPNAHKMARGNSIADLGWRGAVVAVAVTWLLVYLRAPQAILTPQFWGEDGNIFFVQQHIHGSSVLFWPYQGYSVLYQRLGAALASQISITYAPELYFAGWLAAASWSAATIAVARVPFAWLYGSLLMIAPHGGPIFGSLTNAQWMLVPALVFVLATPPPAGMIARANQLLLVAISGLSGPFSILALPLAAWRLWQRQCRFDTVLAAVAVIVATVQLGIMLSSPDRAGMPPETAHWLSGLRMADRWFGQLVHGQPTDNLAAVLWVTLLLAGIVTVLWNDRNRIELLLLLLFAALIVFGGWYKYRNSANSFGPLRGGDRYFFVPRLIVIWILVRGVLGARPSSVIPAAALTAIAFNYTMWSRPILPVLDWRSAAARIERGEETHFPINPLTRPPAMWHVTIPARNRDGQ